MKRKIVILILMITILCTEFIYAAPSGEEAGWRFIEIARKGLFWIGIFTSYYGLYLVLLKKDDSGKKYIVSSVLVYIASFLIPNLFIMIRDTFTK